MYYQSITLENFRGIESLEISDLKTVNLIAGRNNSGKTSILEAFFLLSGMSNPQLPLNIHSFRDLVLTNDEDFSYLFYNLNFSIPIKLIGKAGKKQRDLTITPLFADNNKTKNAEIIKNPSSTFFVSTQTTRDAEGIKFDFRDNFQKFSCQYSLKDNKIGIAKTYREDLVCSFLNAKTIMLQIDKRMEDLIVKKKMTGIIDILKEIEPAITDIRMGSGGMIYVDIGKDKLLPLNIMGDGMRRILAILATIAATRNGVLLIDEIENGFHYASLMIAWKAIFLACHEYNVQLVTTTHSYECIEALTEVYGGLESGGDDIRLYRIGKTVQGHKAYKYTTEQLATGLEKKFEVR